MSSKPTTLSPDGLAPTPTQRCDTRFEKRYEMKDRLARGLFNALCQSMGVDAFTRRGSATAPIYVTAEAAEHARLWSRFVELMPQYDDHVLAAASDFIRTHCGVDLPPAPRR